MSWTCRGVLCNINTILVEIEVCIVDKSFRLIPVRA